MTMACTGSAGAGLIFCCRYIEIAIIIDQAPIIRNDGGVNGNNPNKLNMVVGSGAERS